MGKQDEYRFNLRFDESDEDHRRVCEFLNSCGRKKARYVVKAFLAYWSVKEEVESEKSEPVAKTPEKDFQGNNGFVDLDGDYGMDQAEIALMKKNYAVFEDME